MILHKRKPIILGLAITLFLLGAGLMTYHLMKPKPKVITGGSVTIELDGVDEQFLSQIKEIPSPQSADPTYGGSGIEQSPQYDVDTWRTILEGDIQ